MIFGFPRMFLRITLKSTMKNMYQVEICHSNCSPISLSNPKNNLLKTKLLSSSVYQGEQVTLCRLEYVASSSKLFDPGLKKYFGQHYIVKLLANLLKTSKLQFQLSRRQRWKKIQFICKKHLLTIHSMDQVPLPSWLRQQKK